MTDLDVLLAPSPLPHGLPRLDDVDVADLARAFDVALAAHAEEVAAIAGDPAPPTFASVVEALERSGQPLDRVQRVLGTLSGTASTPELRELEADLAPRLSAHADAILLDPSLFARVTAVHEAADDLDPDQRYLVGRLRQQMALAGAALPEDERRALSAMNAELATLTTRFKAALLADAEALAVHVTDPSRLAGLGAGDVAAARSAAEARGLDGHLLPLVLPAQQPALSSLTDRALRAELLAAGRARGRRGGPHDTRDLVLAIVRLRARRAELLGFPTHAAWRTADQTAGAPEAVAGLLGRLAPVAARNARREAEALQADADALADAEGRPRHPIEAHDWAFHAERVRKRAHDVDEAALRPYLEVDRVLRDGVFQAAGAVFGLTFEERRDLPTHHPWVRTFEVAEADGRPVGLFLLDLHARDGKRGGAWMHALRLQSELLGNATPVVVNTLNVPRPPDGEPVLLTLDEVRTLFHEFGHALHGLLSRVRYPSQAGTAVPRDVVEFPSQVNEMWILWPEVIGRYAVHHRTGEPLDPVVVERLRAAAVDGEGFATSEYLAAAMLDQAWHALSAAEAEAVDDVDAFEAEALAAAGLDDPRVPPRYHSTAFAHVFAGSGYDAAYYGYIWAEVLDADVVGWFERNGGLDRGAGDRFRTAVLAPGGSRDLMEGVRELLGRDPVVDPLLERRGLVE